VGTPDSPSLTDVSVVGANAYIDQSNASSSSTDSEDRTDLEALLSTHPDYDASVEKWEKYTDCYLARDIYRYIYQHSREHEDDFKKRVARGYYYNYVAAIVDLFVAYLFEAGITRETAGDNAFAKEIERFYKDADLSGVNYRVFMQMAATFAITAGHVGLLVDAPKAEEGFSNEEARQRANHRPYLSLIQASQIVDWELDDQNKFVWVKLEVKRSQGRTWRDAYDSNIRNFVIWDRDGWQEWEVKNNDEVDKKGEGEHKLGEVPLVILKNSPSLTHAWFGESAVRDICDINIAILNWGSFADEEIANRCLNILTMQQQDTDKPINIGHYNLLTYEEGTNPPSYLTPGSTPLELIAKREEQGRNEIYRLAKLGGSTGLLGVREATSGVAYAFEFNETNQSLASKAESLEQAEVDIHRLFAKWFDKPEWQEIDTTITYPREFGVEDFLVELQILTEARSTLTSKTAVKEVEKKLAAKLFARDSQELRKKIEGEIESGRQPVSMPQNFRTIPRGFVTDTDKQEDEPSEKE
jgi:hypothetical protein